ncbi:aminotransferase class IV [Kribbella sp. NPDC056861]|uniref:aminotransferase class IV n=1 Tax=Kribbella sp. NPDC056861 TaxID=3154857 RepID=UPI003424A611
MTHLVQLNDAPLALDDPGLLTATTYGHFTSMQVRAGRVRGLDLHLDRLDRSSRELFGHGVSPDRIRGHLRTALASSASADLSIRVTAFSRDKAFLDGPVEPDLLITVTDPIEPTTEPPRLLAVEHERAAPHLKHTGTFTLTHEIRRARLAGYDDALFYDRTGHVSEASIWNICFVAADGRLVWPAGPALPGIAMLTLQAGLDALNVARETVDIPLTALGDYRAAYLTNSIDPALPVASITTPSGTTQYGVDRESADQIATAYEEIPLQEI